MKVIIFTSFYKDKMIYKFINFCKNLFNIIEIYDNKKNIYNKNKFDKNVNFYISFLNPYIIKDKRIINKGCINFHPSLPKYKGVCGGSLALYNNDKNFGATCHYINSKIDDGNIIEVKEFKIPENIDCHELNLITRKKTLNLAKNILNNIFINKKLPESNTEIQWGHIIMTRKKFKKWMILDLDGEITIDEIKNKIKACINDKYEGPYIKFNDKLLLISNLKNSTSI